MKTINIQLENKEFKRVEKAKNLDGKNWREWIIFCAERSMEENINGK